MVKKTWFVMVVALALCLAAGGCGGPSQEQKDAAVTAREDADQAQETADQAQERADQVAAVASSCQSQVKPFVRALANVDSRLGIGLNYADYGQVVSDTKVVYDRVPFGQMKFACFNIAVPAESSMNHLIDAFETWNACFEDLYCDVDSVEPEMQSDWAKASSKLALARSRIADLQANVSDTQSEAETAAAEAEQKDEEADQAEADLEG